ncbi:hypothetical protein ZIOFF_042347 [Zingiber officinale]|uniref:Uncharacterized protein n=1 Tax=Zingiber officinale TaxID=94328 RepID=A0A8J5FX90_ZINOF|nr:hypothetical protein ZIOFF_042347 [Zingiber officinale]
MKATGKKVVDTVRTQTANPTPVVNPPRQCAADRIGPNFCTNVRANRGGSNCLEKAVQTARRYAEKDWPRKHCHSCQQISAVAEVAGVLRIEGCKMGTWEEDVSPLCLQIESWSDLQINSGSGLQIAFLSGLKIVSRSGLQIKSWSDLQINSGSPDQVLVRPSDQFLARSPDQVLHKPDRHNPITDALSRKEVLVTFYSITRVESNMPERIKVVATNDTITYGKLMQQRELLKETHDPQWVGHPGIERMLALLACSYI